MRLADRITALGIFFLGIAVAWKSAELPIGFVPREGPGGGFFPFWFSLGISLAAAVIFVRTYLPQKTGAAGQAEGDFVSWQGFLEILRVGIPGLLMILLTEIVSIYIAGALFVFYCLYFVGRHGLRTSLAVALGTPVGVYLIFEKFLIIPLPKGYLDLFFDLLN